MALPSSIGSLTLHRAQAGGSPVYAEVLPGHTPDGKLTFSARVVDAEGHIYLEMADYRTASLPFSVAADLLAPFRTLIG
jgi:hypothetical protein